jgi:hypothetical protein
MDRRQALDAAPAGNLGCHGNAVIKTANLDP